MTDPVQLTAARSCVSQFVGQTNEARYSRASYDLRLAGIAFVPFTGRDWRCGFFLGPPGDASSYWRSVLSAFQACHGQTSSASRHSLIFVGAIYRRSGPRSRPRPPERAPAPIACPRPRPERRASASVRPLRASLRQGRRETDDHPGSRSFAESEHPKRDRYQRIEIGHDERLACTDLDDQRPEQCKRCCSRVKHGSRVGRSFAEKAAGRLSDRSAGEVDESENRPDEDHERPAKASLSSKR